MSEFLSIMLLPFLACLILTGIHSYLGIHIIKRGVIFVDLALAQIAALGRAVAYLYGYDLHSIGSYLFSLSFALAGAFAFALTRERKQVVSQEAVIGIAYAVAGAAAILVLSRAPEGGEELKALMVGHLLFLGGHEIFKIAILYSLVAAVHWAFRRQFFAISEDPEAAFQSGLSVRWWDFLFYATFAVVVTSSVELAGVLLVFSFLIVPAVCSLLLAQSLRGRLFSGWAVGFLTSVAGVTGSYLLDYPTGAMVVCAFGLSYCICAAWRHIFPLHSSPN